MALPISPPSSKRSTCSRLMKTGKTINGHEFAVIEHEGERGQLKPGQTAFTRREVAMIGHMGREDAELVLIVKKNIGGTVMESLTVRKKGER